MSSVHPHLIWAYIIKYSCARTMATPPKHSVHSTWYIVLIYVIDICILCVLNKYLFCKIKKKKKVWLKWLIIHQKCKISSVCSFCCSHVRQSLVFAVRVMGSAVWHWRQIEAVTPVRHVCLSLPSFTEHFRLQRCVW